MDDQKVIKALLEAQEQGQPVALATVIRTQGSMPRHAGSKMLVRHNGEIVGTVGGGAMEASVIRDALAALNDGQTRIATYRLNNLEDGDPGVCGGTADIFIEPIVVSHTLVVIGCGHVGKALAELGKWLGYRVMVSDDRPEFCTPQHIPGMQGYIVCKPAEITQHITLNPQTYVAAMTRGLPVDLDLIPALLNSNAAYIGVIGSRRRWALTVKALEERGISTDQLSRIHAPIGLELQAETPQEIALSIMAEIVMLRHGGTGKPMKWIGTPDAVDSAL
jgi:xanthine dehydrogenase accessory factor